MTTTNFYERVLRIYAERDGALHWTVEEERTADGVRLTTKMYVWCSNAFGEPSDNEEITPDNLVWLDRAVAAMQSLVPPSGLGTADPIWNATLLFVARMRKTRPVTKNHVIPEALLDDAVRDLQ